MTGHKFYFMSQLSEGIRDNNDKNTETQQRRMGSHCQQVSKRRLASRFIQRKEWTETLAGNQMGRKALPNGV